MSLHAVGNRFRPGSCDVVYSGALCWHNVPDLLAQQFILVDARMKLQEICKLLQGEFLTEETATSNLDIRIAGATDLMSDALAYMKPGSLLLTGLSNIQVLRTVEMADIAAVCFVRGKQPDAKMLNDASESGLPMFKTPFPMFKACGLLWQKGLEPCF